MTNKPFLKININLYISKPLLIYIIDKSNCACEKWSVNHAVAAHGLSVDSVGKIGPGSCLKLSFLTCEAQQEVVCFRSALTDVIEGSVWVVCTQDTWQMATTP